MTSRALPRELRRTGTIRILSCAVAIILPMVETLGQVRWRCAHQGFRRTKICSLPRFGSSVLRRRISFSTSGCQCFFVAPEVPYCAGLAPQVLPCSVTDATSKACGRTRQRLQKPQKYRVYPRSAEPSFSLLLYQPSLKASTHNRPFRIANHQMLHLHSAISPYLSGGNCNISVNLH